MAENKNRKLNTDGYVFTFAAQPNFSVDESNPKGKRKFAGVAYSGEIIENHPVWGNVVFDLHSISIPARLPALIDHDRAQRAGYVTDSSIDLASGFAVSGELLSNSAGTSVASDSDEGFPWQMSIHIQPNSIEELSAGASATVNGRTFTGPLTIFRNSKIVEVSFAATGWDSNTSAVAMSQSLLETNKGNSMEIKQLEEKIKEQDAVIAQFKADNENLKGQLETAKAEAEKFSLSARQAAIKQLFFSVGREYKENSEDVKGFLAMPQEAFDFASKVITEQASDPIIKQKDNFLFQHQAKAGTSAHGTVEEDPLIANAKIRAQQFSNRAI